MEHRNLEIIRAELEAAENEKFSMDMDAPRYPIIAYPFGEWDGDDWEEDQLREEAAYKRYDDARRAYEAQMDALCQRIYDLSNELKRALEEQREKNRKAKERAKKRKAASKAEPVPVGMVYAA